MPQERDDGCRHLEPYMQPCPAHGDDPWACPDILFCRTASGPGIPVRDGGRSAVTIRFCPFCGVRLTPPTEARAALLAAEDPGPPQPDRRQELLRGVAEAYERWEADMLLDNEAWHGGLASLPTLTYPLWDRLLEIQRLRNTALGRR